MMKAYFGEATERREQLAKDLDYVQDILREGAKKANERAESVMEPVRAATGLIRTRG